MSFTELEGLLLLAVGVLLWRIEVLNTRVRRQTEQSDRYAAYLMDLYHKRGVVRRSPEGRYFFERNKHEDPKQTGQS